MTRILVLTILCCTTAVLALDGYTVGRKDGELRLVDMSDGTYTVLQDSCSNYHGASFSPDGRQIAVLAQYRYLNFDMYIIDNDGGNTVKILDLTDVNGNGVTPLTWTETGHVYWSTNTYEILRIDVSTREVEVVHTSQYHVSQVSVSQDGSVAGATAWDDSPGSNWAQTYDLVAGVDIDQSRYPGYGCYASPSPDGSMITHNQSGGITWEGHGLSYHQWAKIEDFETGAAIDTVTIDVYGDRFAGFLWARHSMDYITYTNDSKGYGVVCEWASNTKTPATAVTNAFDFWPGTLPTACTDCPSIALDPNSLTFASIDGAVPSAQTVTATNSGNGTLTQPSISGDPSWLTVAVSGSADSWTLTNTVDATGLTVGAHTATVTVSGGGASVGANYEVTLNVSASAQAPNAPTSLDATGTYATSTIDLVWVDNSDNETGFSVERMPHGGAFAELATVAAGVTTYADDAVTEDVTYVYRVRAFNGDEYSGYTNVDSAAVTEPASVTILSPAAGDSVAMGGVLRIQWSAVKVERVNIALSTDEGETFVNIYGRAVSTSDAAWGDTTYQLPAGVESNGCILRIASYLGEAELQTGLFVVSASAPVHLSYRSRSAAANLMNGPVGMTVIGSGNGSTALVPAGSRVQVYTLNGSRAADVLQSGGATCAELLDPAARAGGYYLLQIKPGAAGNTVH